MKMKRIFPLTVGGAVVAAAVLLWSWADRPAVNTAGAETGDNASSPSQSAASAPSAASAASAPATAILAGGCFWCMESAFEKIDGVGEVISGYTGGRVKDPTYRQVGAGGTGHTEAVQIHYDPEKISFRGLLHYLWREIDPTDSSGQFVDRGSMYRPAIYYHNEQEKQMAVESRDQLEASGRFAKPITIEITPAQTFYPAEDYHQDYYKTNAYRYKIYRHGSGRDQFLKKIWGEDLHTRYEETGDASADASATDNDAKPATAAHPRYGKPADARLRSALTGMQYEVTQHEGTEPPFRNEYWDHKQAGIYVDIVSGEPLFSSTDKYKSGTGWPSFSKPIDADFIVQKTDYKLLYPRTELRSKYGDSHLGHVFNDGPAPTGLRYCINSASLRFVAKNQLAQSGYGEYAELFE